MPNSKLRLQIAWEAARLMYERQESEFYRAKIKAARKLCHGWAKPADLPSNSEIRDQVQMLARLYEGDRRTDNLQKNRFQVYEALLLPLDNVRQNLKYHPEGDVLYHSLQVFDHARDELPYDEEFLIAALLHDVGKGIDQYDHVAAALEALDDTISERTAWLIEHHMLAHGIAERTIGSRAHRRLRQSEYYEDLILLGDCDRAGRQSGVEAPELEDALGYLRELEQMFG